LHAPTAYIFLWADRIDPERLDATERAEVVPFVYGRRQLVVPALAALAATETWFSSTTLHLWGG
jgi:hypothetical protein